MDLHRISRRARRPTASLLLVAASTIAAAKDAHPNPPANEATVAAYRAAGASAVRAFTYALGGRDLDHSGVATTGAFPRAPGPRDRVALLSYPNSGTSYTLHRARCLTAQFQCTSYVKELKQRARRPCGRGAWFLNGAAPPPEGLRVLFKTHGKPGHYPYRQFAPAVEGNPLATHFRDAFGGEDEYAGVLRLVRNPFDNLASRFHNACNSMRHHDCPGGVATRDLFLRSWAATKDVCNFLHWHHRAQLVKASATRPWTTLAYETIYAAPERHDAALMSIVSPGRARIADGDPRACGEHDPGRAKPRNISRAADGFVLPTYLGLFDAPAVRRLARQIGSYVRRSENLTTPFLPPCFARNATTPRPGPREASRRRPVF